MFRKLHHLMKENKKIFAEFNLIRALNFIL
jgi:hypothetical protein